MPFVTEVIDLKCTYTGNIDEIGYMEIGGHKCVPSIQFHKFKYTFTPDQVVVYRMYMKY